MNPHEFIGVNPNWPNWKKWVDLIIPQISAQHSKCKPVDRGTIEIHLKVTGEGKFAAEIFTKTDRLASWCQCHQMNRQISRLGKASSFPTVKVVRKKSPMSQVYKKRTLERSLTTICRLEVPEYSGVQYQCSAHSFWLRR